MRKRARGTEATIITTSLCSGRGFVSGEGFGGLYYTEYTKQMQCPTYNSGGRVICLKNTATMMDDKTHIKDTGMMCAITATAAMQSQSTSYRRRSCYPTVGPPGRVSCSVEHRMFILVLRYTDGVLGVLAHQLLQQAACRGRPCRGKAAACSINC